MILIDKVANGALVCIKTKMMQLRPERMRKSLEFAIREYRIKAQCNSADSALGFYRGDTEVCSFGMGGVKKETR